MRLGSRVVLYIRRNKTVTYIETPTDNRDLELIKQIEGLGELDSDYWSFKGRSKRTGAHALFQYPAMMVPQMQGILLDAVRAVDPEIKTVFDPFVGVGTTLGESMARGLNFVGYDINPLAILACRVKSSPICLERLQKKIEILKNNITQDKSNKIDVSFNGINKWFLVAIQQDLSRIRRSIKLEKSLWARRFFWLTLCSVVREVCNSRQSTYKLHIKPVEESLYVDSIKLFFEGIAKNFENLTQQRAKLQETRFITHCKYVGKTSIRLHDSRVKRKIDQKVDLVLTSPPYGDNLTTVPYGQFSYLPLQWIELSDISPSLSADVLETQTTIDRRSLGGVLQGWDSSRRRLCAMSPSLGKCVKLVEERKPKEIRKILSFFSDLELSLVNIVSQLKCNGYMVWTVGNRHVAGVEIQLNKILRELLESMGCNFVFELVRPIPSKRMASKNNNSVTMTNELVLIARKYKSINLTNQF